MVWCDTRVCVSVKVKLVVANEMVPHLLAEEYMDRGDYENELRQVHSTDSPTDSPHSLPPSLAPSLSSLSLLPTHSLAHAVKVIGETKTAYDISEHDVLIFGDEGLMLVGPNSRHHEPLLCSYVEVRGVGPPLSELTFMAMEGVECGYVHPKLLSATVPRVGYHPDSQGDSLPSRSTNALAHLCVCVDVGAIRPRPQYGATDTSEDG